MGTNEDTKYLNFGRRVMKVSKKCNLFIGFKISIVQYFADAVSLSYSYYFYLFSFAHNSMFVWYSVIS